MGRNKLELQVLAMKRSGHHAIISWIIKNQPGNVFFRNDLLEGHKDPGSILTQRKGNIKRALDCYIFNVEDAPVNKANKLISRNIKIVRFRKSEKILRILILRDPFNLFASRMQWAINHAKQKRRYKKMLIKGKSFGAKKSNQIGNVGWANKDAVIMWKNYAKVFLKGHAAFGESVDTICINYNKWFTSRGYRSKILASIGIKPSSAPYTWVPKYGGGSSFGGSRRMNDKGVLTRWRKLIGNKEYISLFSGDNELIELSEEIFGPTDKIILSKIQ
jgi:hypothetical protein